VRPNSAVGEDWIAKVHHPKSGRVLLVDSDAPGLQLYTGNHLRGSQSGKHGKSFLKYGGLCLEPQAFPNAPNEASFPSAQLEPGERYEHSISYRFLVDPE